MNFGTKNKEVNNQKKCFNKNETNKKSNVVDMTLYFRMTSIIISHMKNICLVQIQRRPWQPNGCVCIGDRRAFNVLFHCIGERLLWSTPLQLTHWNWRIWECIDALFWYFGREVQPSVDDSRNFRSEWFISYQMCLIINGFVVMWMLFMWGKGCKIDAIYIRIIH